MSTRKAPHDSNAWVNNNSFEAVLIAVPRTLGCSQLEPTSTARRGPLQTSDVLTRKRLESLQPVLQPAEPAAPC
jgi:hypothetical protein